MRRYVEEYSPSALEEKWIEQWNKDGLYRFKDDGNPKKMYILDMFPYPSGSGLHVGHLKGYLATDILTRFYRMKGYLVFHPMGWDAFGLPAEQYAIKTGHSPAEFTRKNINNFRSQLKRLMLTYDFAYEVDTSSPEYYKHTQWIFSEMYQRGLAKFVDTQVNWCEELNTVLSDEEIVVDKDHQLFSERGNYPVQIKTMKQWVLKITKYADELLKDISLLEWPENVKKIQKAWIGAANKYEYPFRFCDDVYPLYLKYASSIRRLKGVGIHQFSELSKKLNVNPNNTGDRELVKGVELVNMVDFSKVPVYYLWNIDFRSDELIPLFEGSEEDFYDGEIEKYYLSKERIPAAKRTYKLKDWVFSRQRFWGEPIPILFDSEGMAILDFDLPVKLPNKVDYKTKRHAQSPLANDDEWVNVTKHGFSYRRETSTMPNWAGSSWYFIAYLLKKPDGTYHKLDSPEAKKILDRWLPVDIYVGGQEHATMHLLYARFWHKFLRKIGVVSSPEPFKTLLNQGMVLGSDGTKMSKSKGNYVSIDEIIEKYGADTLRVYEAFSGPTQLSFKWEDDGIRGSHRWLHKVHIFFRTLGSLNCVKEGDVAVDEIENQLIKSVESAIPNLKINLGVSSMMIFLNEIQKLGKYHMKAMESFVKILGLYAPALAEEIWRVRMAHKTYLLNSDWPSLNKLHDDPHSLFKVFMDGKFKFTLDLKKEDFAIHENYLRNRLESKLMSDAFKVKDIMWDKRIILIESSGST